MRKILIKLLPFLFTKMDLEERVDIWCKSIGKHPSYGKNMTHEKLNELKVDKYK